MICFYCLAGAHVFEMKRAATANILPAIFRNNRYLLIGGVIGLIMAFVLRDLTPLYGLNRIMLAQSNHDGAAVPRKTT
jgi:hypothetical protein